METKALGCLINSISRFILLAMCSTSNTMPTQKDHRDVVNLLKLLKPVLDGIIDCKMPLDGSLSKECEELDIAVNDAREFLENCSPKRCKIYSVVQSNQLMLKIQSSSLKICGILCRLLESSQSTSSIAKVQECMHKFQSLELEPISEHTKEALSTRKEGKMPNSDNLMVIMELLNLTSKQELLKESIAVEKERIRAQEKNMTKELVQIDQIVDLISHIRDCLNKFKSYNSINGVTIPSYFRCPLSLELMLDPVIVASGQTYERASIQKWLDNGLTFCPRTRQSLLQTSLIPNHTVKAMISSWCEENKIKLSHRRESTDTVSVLSSVYPPNFNSHTGNEKATSGSSFEAGAKLDKQKVNNSSSYCHAEPSADQCRDTEILGHSSPEKSFTHGGSESTGSAASSIDCTPTVSADVSNISNNESISKLSGEMTNEGPSSPMNKFSRNSPLAFEKRNQSSKTMAEMPGNKNHNPCRMLSFPSESGSSDLTTISHVEILVEDLRSQSNELQTVGASELRFLAKHNKENRDIIVKCGAIAPLISLLHSNAKITQEHAVTALLNLSINENVKTKIAEAGALEPLIHVLETGNSGAKENAAATLFSLSVLEEYRVKIGRSGAVKALVDLLCSGTLRGKKDAATALFNLTIFHENKARIVQAGAVKLLVGLLDPEKEMVDKAVALLANLSTIAEGCSAIAREGGIPLLVEVIESGSQRGKENAASILLQLCMNNPKYCRLALQEGAVPPLLALSQSGTTRAREKAQQLLSHFRNQRESASGRRKPL